MKLRYPCKEHGRYDAHIESTPIKVRSGQHFDLRGVLIDEEGLHCPGGEFLADDALVIEKVDGEWPAWFLRLIRPGLEATLTVREGAE